jgi:hypothetical protein
MPGESPLTGRQKWTGTCIELMYIIHF